MTQDEDLEKIDCKGILEKRGSACTIAQKQANELGLYDMSGNVMEWCWDRNRIENKECNNRNRI
jgi:formylglycine-generating enzyme required for sulfatase activity